MFSRQEVAVLVLGAFIVGANLSDMIDAIGYLMLQGRALLIVTRDVRSEMIRARDTAAIDRAKAERQDGNDNGKA